MSTHIACNGLAGDQRIAFMSYTKGKGIPGRKRLPTSESRKKAADGLVTEKNVGFLNSTNGNKIKPRKLAVRTKNLRQNYFLVYFFVHQFRKSKKSRLYTTKMSQILCRIGLKIHP